MTTTDTESNSFKNLDVLENEIKEQDEKLLEILLQDKTTGRNILWCTCDYIENGNGFGEHDEITVAAVTNNYGKVIQPRAAKNTKVQLTRVRSKGEVFTPSWVCNEQNNQIDEAWFGRANVFNTPNGTTWKRSPGAVCFWGMTKTWQDYVKTPRLEITCGEAPYLVSRYDTTTGHPIHIYDRIGLFDRKMRVLDENCKTRGKDWIEWSLRAVKSIYGFEFQGDSIVIARENILFSYIDYYVNRFGRSPSKTILRRVATIIAWNIWQMDGLKCVVPFSCHNTTTPSLFPNNPPDISPCPGCAIHSLKKHNGIKCRIRDWDANKTIVFSSLLHGEHNA